MIIKRLTFILLILLSADLYSQRIKEKNIVSFRIYDYRTFPPDKEFPDYSLDDIAKMTYYEVPLDSLKGLIGRPWRLLIAPIYKGSTFATVDLKNGKRKRIKMSTYGGFYEDLDSEKYYTVSSRRYKKLQLVLRNARRRFN